MTTPRSRLTNPENHWMNYTSAHDLSRSITEAGLEMHWRPNRNGQIRTMVSCMGDCDLEQDLLAITALMDIGGEKILKDLHSPHCAYAAINDREEPETEDIESACVICMSRRARYASADCGHLTYCRECVSSTLRSRSCPACRAPTTRNVFVSDNCTGCGETKSVAYVCAHRQCRRRNNLCIECSSDIKACKGCLRTDTSIKIYRI